MALESKVSLLNQIESRIGQDVSFEDMPKIMSGISDVLQRFIVQEIANENNETDDMLKCYLDALKVQGRSALTLQRYEYVLRKMMSEVNTQTRRITKYHLLTYLANEQARGIQESTLEGIREIFSAYFNWLQRESLIDRNPTANLGTIKVPKKIKKVYTGAENEKIDRCDMPIRDRAIIYFLRATGCRVSEMTGLNRDQVDLEKMRCVVHGKGDKERTVFLDEEAVMVLKEYLEQRKDDEEALFIGKKHERLSPGGVRLMLNKVAKMAGVEHIHPHKFRRTMATNLASRGMPIQEVAALLGHDKLDTTMRYVVLDSEDIRHSYKKYAG